LASPLIWFFGQAMSEGAYHSVKATTETKGGIMKTIPVEQLGERVAKALEQQDEHEAIRLTRNAGTVAWLLRVPETMKDAEADVVVCTEGPAGRVFLSCRQSTSWKDDRNKNCTRRYSARVEGP